MLNTSMSKRFSLILILLLVISLSLVACGRRASRAVPTLIPMTISGTSARPTEPAPSLPGNADGLLVQGEEIFQKTAGGLGCQYCHGTDAKGNIGPNIRGKPEEAIQNALGLVQQMSFIHLSDQEIEAVATYLKYLESQP